MTLPAQDIVERLRGHRQAFGVHYEQREVEVCIEAADFIKSLLADAERVASLIDEGLGILNDLADNIRRHGNYSPESTCMFIDQAGQAFREAHTVTVGGHNG